MWKLIFGRDMNRVLCNELKKIWHSNSNISKLLNQKQYKSEVVSPPSSWVKSNLNLIQLNFKIGQILHCFTLLLIHLQNKTYCWFRSLKKFKECQIFFDCIPCNESKIIPLTYKSSCNEWIISTYYYILLTKEVE